MDRREIELEEGPPPPSAPLLPIEEESEDEPVSPVIEPKETTDEISSLDLAGDAPMPEYAVAVSKRPRRVGRVYHVRLYSPPFATQDSCPS